MKVMATDFGERPVAPRDFLAYLRSRAWHLDPSYAGVSSFGTALFVHEDGEEVHIPLSESARDYVALLSEAINKVARVERRPGQQVLNDLRVALADVVRLANVSGDDVGIRLSEGAALLGGAKDLVTAAALAATGPRPIYPGRRRQSVVDLLRDVILGQTEPGSFAVRVLVPLSTRYGSAPNAAAGIASSLDPGKPTPRQVTDMLAQAVAHARRAADTAIATDDLDCFKAAVPHGVSSELCRAIASAMGEDKADIVIDVSWALSRPGPPVRRVVFSSGTFEVLAQASKFLARTAKRTDFDLFGWVERMSGEPTERTRGEVVILGEVDGELKKVAVVLGEEDYRVAIEAHKNESPVHVIGELVQQGGRYRLENPSDVYSLPSRDDDGGESHDAG